MPLSDNPIDPLAEIRSLYFRTTKQTIADDFDHAIDLLKSMPDQSARDRAAVYMEGLAQMKAQWVGLGKPPARRSPGGGRPRGRR